MDLSVFSYCPEVTVRENRLAIVDVELLEESQDRYITYALSVVNSRALPDVRDGLKPVQRRILYAMIHNLTLRPEHNHRKSAAVVGEVLARYHPHGDSACYEAMVRMAQDFSYRYPLVDGQGNFGSLDGDSAAAYRYTEVRLTRFALEVIGDIGQETVAERQNFDQTTTEPIVLPSRVPNLLVNGATGIAVGMATSIPPHNLKDVVKALLLLLEDPQIKDARLVSAVRGPDFPTACSILNTVSELQQIYSTGRGAIRMRADWAEEKGAKDKNYIVISSIPYAVDKSVIVEQIADLIINRKVPQLVDVRDESTDEVRIVLELNQGADAEKAMAYLFKHTPLQTNFNVNLTALVPTKNVNSGRPMQLTLRQMLQEFLTFRTQVFRCKLVFERNRLAERAHLLEGIIGVFDLIKEIIEIVRKSEGRQDAAKKLVKSYDLTELQAFFIVDLRIYQLSRTNIDELQKEFNEKQKRIAEINEILNSEKALQDVVREDLERVSSEFGDVRRSKIIGEFEQTALIEEEYIEHEEVYAIVTKDGWLKRIRSSNDPQTTRIREGDALSFVEKASTRDLLAIFTNHGNYFVTRIMNLATTSGFGEPVQKLFKFQDGEMPVTVIIVKADSAEREYIVTTKDGLGFKTNLLLSVETKKNGKRIARLGENDVVVSIIEVTEQFLLLTSKEGYVLCLHINDVPLLSGAGKGVILQKMSKGDTLVKALCVSKNAKLLATTQRKGEKRFNISGVTIAERAKRGDRLISKDLPVVDVVVEVIEKHDTNHSAQKVK